MLCVEYNIGGQMDREIYEFNIMKSFYLKTSSLGLQHIIRYSILYNK